MIILESYTMRGINFVQHEKQYEKLHWFSVYKT